MSTLFSRRLVQYAVGGGVFSVAMLAIVFFFIPERTGYYQLEEHIPAGAPTNLTTDTWGVFDVTTGKVLAGNNIDVRRPIASITKLFTAEVALNSIEKHTPFIIEHYDVVSEGRAGKLMLGTYMTPYELLFPLLLESSNDAGEAIRRHLDITFETTIRTLKVEIPLQNTVIVDGTGLNPRNVSTVSDLARYYAYLLKTHPHILDITRLKTYIGEHAGYINNNPARALDTFLGGKHGYIDESGRTFVGAFLKEDGVGEIGLVLLKSDDLVHDIQTLLTYTSALQ